MLWSFYHRNMYQFCTNFLVNKSNHPILGMTLIFLGLDCFQFVQLVQQVETFFILFLTAFIHKMTLQHEGLHHQ
jgi:hypothetical protein